MVKLTVSTEAVKAKEPLKVPLDDTCDVPLEKQTVVHLKQKECCSRRVVGVALAIVIALSVGGAIIGVYFGRHPLSRQCYDWGPGCALKEPPKFESHHAQLNGGEIGNIDIHVSGHEGLSDSHSTKEKDQDSVPGSGSSDSGGRSGDHDHRPSNHIGDHDSSGGRSHGHGGRHPHHDRSGPRFPPAEPRTYPPGPAGPQGRQRHHPRPPKHRRPIP